MKPNMTPREREARFFRGIHRRIDTHGTLGTLMLGVATFSILVAGALLFAGNAPKGKPSLILKNGHIWTGYDAVPWAEALAISGNKIIKVGTNAEIAPLEVEGVKVIDLGGKLATPGLNDAHIHLIKGGLSLLEVGLTDAKSLGEIQHRVRKYADEHPGNGWIVGTGWLYTMFPNSLPTRTDLDVVVRDRPIYLRCYDGHTVWVNSKALEVAGINRNTRFQGYGEIVRDPATGEPTGILKEKALSLIKSAVPLRDSTVELPALRMALKLMASLGITSVQLANGDPGDLSLYDQLLKGNELTVRVSMAMSVKPTTPASRVQEFSALKAKYQGSRLRVGAVKIILDGVIESRTAAMLQPYNDKPESSGSAAYSQERLNELVAQCDKAGFQIYTHAIGDGAVRMALDSYENALKLNGPHDARFRIEHIETVSPQDIPRFAKLGVLASMMPIHADPSLKAAWAPPVGPEREQLAFAWRSLQKAGALLVFSSDWRATISVDPIRGIHNAVNRRTIDGYPAEAWIPKERVTLDSALRAYTGNSAYTSFEEKIKGVLAEGMLADVVVYSQDMFKTNPMDICKTRVAMTIFDGRVIYP